MTDSRAAVRALLFGNFAIGCGVMVVPGMLVDLARGLEVSLASAGQLIALAAFVSCVGGPLAAAFTSRIDRRVLLVGALLLYTAGHVASALAPGYASLAALRGVTVIAAAVFTPQAAATIGLMVPVEQRAGAVASVFLGWSVASVLGMPLGNLIGAELGWRWVFGVAALLAAIGAVWVGRTIPRGLRVPPLSLAAWANVAGNRLLVSVLGVSLLGAAGQFALFAYSAPLLSAATGASTMVVAALMALFGVFGVAGNAWMARHIGRWGPDRAVSLAMGAMLTGVACATLTTVALAPGLAPSPEFAHGVAWTLVIASCLFWGLGCFAMNSAQQARLVALAPALASASIALNSSVMYGGQAAGAALGGAVLTAVGLWGLPWVAGVLLLATWGWSSRLDTR